LQTGQKYIQEYTQAEYIIHFDSDGQHQTKDIQTFITYADNHPNVDIIFGTRFHSDSQAIPLSRIIHKKLHLLFARVFIRINLSDTNNGFRLLRKCTLDNIIITMNDYSHASEIETMTVNKELNYAEVPVNVRYDTNPHGQSLRNALHIAKRIIYRTIFFK
jgi:glycosyltransferase involved in cell wall biosynthesis